MEGSKMVVCMKRFFIQTNEKENNEEILIYFVRSYPFILLLPLPGAFH